jgi:ribosomal protein S18 acetylase RimI-like enzyme
VITVRGVRAGEGPQLRQLRIRAMADAPEVFGSTLEHEEGLPDEHWVALADGGEEFGVYVAIDGEDWIGMAAGRWFARDRGVVQLWGMWIDPTRRGERIGERLAGAVKGWASDHEGRFLRLGVIEGSRAIAFYERLGFVDTGERRPLTRDPSVTAVYMARPA